MDLDAIHELTEQPEYKNVQEFVQYCKDDSRTTYNHIELRALCYNCRQSSQFIRSALEKYGITLSNRPFEKKIRGFTANNHNRYQTCPSHGGSGWQQISGFAGRVG